VEFFRAHIFLLSQGVRQNRVIAGLLFFLSVFSRLPIITRVVNKSSKFFELDFVMEAVRAGG